MGLNIKDIPPVEYPNVLQAAAASKSVKLSRQKKIGSELLVAKIYPTLLFGP